MQSRNRHIQRIHPERYPACLDEVHVFVPTPEHLVSDVVGLVPGTGLVARTFVFQVVSK